MLNRNLAILLESNIVDQLNSKSYDNEVATITTSNSIWEFFGLVLLLAIILIATYYTTKFIGKAKAGQLKSSNFELIDSYPISPGKMLQIIKIADKYIVIAVGKDTVQFITELEESQVILKNVKSEERQSFKKILETMKDKMKFEAK
jgi:flagellar protein FliO/FliZ